MAFLQGASSGENIEDFFLNWIHERRRCAAWPKKQKHFARGSRTAYRRVAVLNCVPLEDELGDVLEKAMRRAGLNEEALSERAGVATTSILDAINYRSELSDQ